MRGQKTKDGGQFELRIVECRLSILIADCATEFFSHPRNFSKQKLRKNYRGDSAKLRREHPPKGEVSPKADRGHRGYSFMIYDCFVENNSECPFERAAGESRNLFLNRFLHSALNQKRFRTPVGMTVGLFYRANYDLKEGIAARGCSKGERV
jgi:hypothetical protein